MSIEAYWLKANKRIDVGGYTHIYHIIQNPMLFGLTQNDVESCYKKHNEKLYTEKNARQELIQQATHAGWVRVRKYKEYWSIQFDRYSKRKAVIHAFVKWAVLNKKIMSQYDPLVLVGFDDHYSKTINASAFLTKK